MSSLSTNDYPDSGRKASHVCTPCRKQKKACDKIFPSCSTCSRLRRECSYESGPAPDVGSLESLSVRLTNLEDEMSEHRAICDGRIAISAVKSTSYHPLPQGISLDTSSAMSSAFFLDVNIFRQQNSKAPKPQFTIDGMILDDIGDKLEFQTIIGAYFFSVAPWMCIIQRNRFYDETLASQVELTADILFLILCMKLLNDTIPPQETPRTELWYHTKNRFLSLVSSGYASIRLLQAGVLFCLYESGHSIYPEAYISIGHLARLGQAIGLHDTAGIPQLALEPNTWDEMEERRRVWWALWILDRHMNVGNPSRALAMAEIGRREYLPVDDISFERGVQTISEPLFVSSSTDITTAPLARLCQASHLLSLVLKHVNDRDSSAEDHLEEAKQLSRAILALYSFMDSEIGADATRIFVSRATCLSALFTLYEHSSVLKQGSFALTAELELNELGISGLNSLVPHVTAYTTHIQTVLPYNLGQASPLICHCLYRMAVWILSLSAEMMRPEYSKLLHCTRETLLKLSMRWQVAGAYLKMLNHMELSSSSEPISQD
ncbi:hypothetical protein BKA64DRAFT_82589 [Cadophora sp. MPI-SDFR-AT-0126]|nr:hypothetical protein BKA64DRAFT_82589 [Leotiomycetes sp. MPI-SDFR-AT-0126]